MESLDDGNSQNQAHSVPAPAYFRPAPPAARHRPAHAGGRARRRRARCEVPLQLPDDPLRQHRLPVLVALAGPDHQAAPVEVDVLHAQRQALPQAEPGPVDDDSHQTVDPVKMREDPSNLVHREHHGEMLPYLRAYHRFEIEHRYREHVAEQEQQGIECLPLGCSRDLPVNRQVRKEGLEMLFR